MRNPNAPRSSKSEKMVVHTVTREDGSTYEVQVPARLTKRFKQLCTSMKRLLVEVQKYAPEGSLYLQEDSPHLMVGLSHVGHRDEACQENVLVSGADWPRSGGGGW